MHLHRTASPFASSNPIPRMTALSVTSPATAPQQQQQNQAPLASPDYHREAQQIVKEEREQREKMPNYPVSRQKQTEEPKDCTDRITIAT
jgi:hypothetical protein